MLFAMWEEHRCEVLPDIELSDPEGGREVSMGSPPGGQNRTHPGAFGGRRLHFCTNAGFGFSPGRICVSTHWGGADFRLSPTKFWRRRSDTNFDRRFV